MLFQVKVKVNISKMPEFGQKLQKGELDRSSIRGDTYCLKNDPAIGFSIWEAIDRNEFEKKFNSWSKYYDDIEIKEMITAQEAQKLLLKQLS